MLVTKTTSSNLNYFVRPTVQSSKIFINSVHNTAKNSKFLDLRRRFLSFFALYCFSKYLVYDRNFNWLNVC